MLHLPTNSPDPPIRLLMQFALAFPNYAMPLVVCAPERRVWVAAADNTSDQFTVIAPDIDGRTTFSLQTVRNKRTIWQRPLPRWAYYPAGVTLLLDNLGMDVLGLDVVVVGDEPLGPVYEYGMGMAFAALWHELHQKPYTEASLLHWMERVRREFVQSSHV